MTLDWDILLASHQKTIPVETRSAQQAVTELAVPTPGLAATCRQSQELVVWLAGRNAGRPPSHSSSKFGPGRPPSNRRRAAALGHSDSLTACQRPDRPSFLQSLISSADTRSFPPLLPLFTHPGCNCTSVECQNSKRKPPRAYPNLSPSCRVAPYLFPGIKAPPTDNCRP